MAEDTPVESAPKSKGKGKIAGIPKPVVFVAAGVGVLLIYRWYKNRNASSLSSTATPTASSGAPVDTSGGFTSGSGGGGFTNLGVAKSSPTDTSSLTPAPPAPVNRSSITPIGKKTISVGGKSFNTVSGFMQNGDTYLGIDNPAEAKRLEQQGVSLVHNPNDPKTSSLFVLVPKGKSGPVIKKPPAKK